jgi:PIN domain nuclease of toxin-antitoxin system
MAWVFDASTVICLVKEESGGERALEMLEEGVYVSAINLAELFSWAGLHSELETQDVLDLIEELEIKVVDFGWSLAAASGELVPQTRKYGLSLGDRACLALGKQLGLSVVTCDKVWSQVSVECEVVVLR